MSFLKNESGDFLPNPLDDDISLDLYLAKKIVAIYRHKMKRVEDERKFELDPNCVCVRSTSEIRVWDCPSVFNATISLYARDNARIDLEESYGRGEPNAPFLTPACVRHINDDEPDIDIRCTTREVS